MSTRQAYSSELEFVIAEVWNTNQPHSKTLDDGTEIYAYPHADGVAWGVNGGENGFCIKRGVRTPEGKDMCEM